MSWLIKNKGSIQDMLQGSLLNEHGSSSNLTLHCFFAVVPFPEHVSFHISFCLIPALPLHSFLQSKLFILLLLSAFILPCFRVFLLSQHILHSCWSVSSGAPLPILYIPWSLSNGNIRSASSLFENFAPFLWPLLDRSIDPELILPKFHKCITPIFRLKIFCQRSNFSLLFLTSNFLTASPLWGKELTGVQGEVRKDSLVLRL